MEILLHGKIDENFLAKTRSTSIRRANELQPCVDSVIPANSNTIIDQTKKSTAQMTLVANNTTYCPQRLCFCFIAQYLLAC